MASSFISIDRNCPIELPTSLEGGLREDHPPVVAEGRLARFVVDVVEQLDLSESSKSIVAAVRRRIHRS